jgi:GDP-L-fucose synthase
MDSTRLNALGWQAKINLEQGLALAYQDFKHQFDRRQLCLK